ncbi:S24 family peptidase [Aeromonas jandaei]|uniref:S24 family peptidase n=1 Tax=Aeromonas jandaei TaxID=650 RepID=UPI002B058894|nr:S24 family peptidase [Aeromonas jandaei]
MRIDTLGQRLTFLRENVLKLNKAQLAEQLGMSDAWLGKVEKDAYADIGAKIAHQIGIMVEPYGYDTRWLIVGGDKPSKGRRIPIVGNTQAGPDGVWFDMGYPDGFSDTYIDFPSRGNTYGLMVVGSSMDPYYREGEAVIVDPNAEPLTGEVVVVRMADDEVMLKVFTGIRNGEVVLDSLNTSYSRQLRKQEDMQFMHQVVGKVTGSKIIHSV